MTMGIGIGRRSSSSYPEKDVAQHPVDIARGNPNPNNYNILRTVQIGKYLVILIHYPDCKNYEGKKILMYENITIEQLIKQQLIDPHFSNNKKYKSPIARFQPTDNGWDMAMACATQQR